MIFIREGGIVKCCPLLHTNSRNNRIIGLPGKNGMLKIYINGELDNSALNPQQVNPRIKACPLVTSKEMKEDASDIVITNYALSYKEVASAFLK